MHYRYLVLTVLASSSLGLAQSVPQGASPITIRTIEERTNAAPPAAATAVAAAETGPAKQARIMFLMSTGGQYADAGEYPEAERAYVRALENDPGNPGILASLSTLYIRMERYKEAAGILEDLAARFPESPVVHNNLAWIYSTGGAMKNAKLAVRHAHEALLSNPLEASLWNTLAEAYYVSGQYDKARRACDYAIELLRLQGAAEATVTDYEKQRAKIQRADEASKRFLNLDSGQ